MSTTTIEVGTQSQTIRFTQLKITTSNGLVKHDLVTHFNKLGYITINIINQLCLIVYIETEFKFMYLDVLSLNFGIVSIETINL